MDVPRVSIGLAGALDHAVIAALAPVIESLGFRAARPPSSWEHSAENAQDGGRDR